MFFKFVIVFKKCGFFLGINFKFKFIFKGIIKILLNKIVVFMFKIFIGCKVIFVVRLLFLYNFKKFFVFLWFFWYLLR